MKTNLTLYNYNNKHWTRKYLFGVHLEEGLQIFMLLKLIEVDFSLAWVFFFFFEGTRKEGFGVWFTQESCWSVNISYWAFLGGAVCRSFKKQAAPTSSFLCWIWSFLRGLTKLPPAKTWGAWGCGKKAVKNLNCQLDVCKTDILLRSNSGYLVLGYIWINCN